MGGFGGCRGCWADGRRRGICGRCRRRRFAIGGRSEGEMATEMGRGSARDEVLRRVRAAKGGAAHAEAVRAAYGAVERGYRSEATRSREGVLELLVDRLQDYDARVLEAVHVDVRTAVAT